MVNKAPASLWFSNSPSCLCTMPSIRWRNCASDPSSRRLRPQTSTNLTKEDMPFLRSTRHQQVFDSAKVLATSVPCLAYYDVTAPVILWVDASDYDLGAALLQPIKPHNGSALDRSSSTTHFVQFHETNPYRAALCAKWKNVPGYCWSLQQFRPMAFG